eukprot:2488203-Karenia_brevis.AAC.1
MMRMMMMRMVVMMMVMMKMRMRMRMMTMMAHEIFRRWSQADCHVQLSLPNATSPGATQMQMF